MEQTVATKATNGANCCNESNQLERIVATKATNWSALLQRKQPIGAHCCKDSNQLERIVATKATNWSGLLQQKQPIVADLVSFCNCPQLLSRFVLFSVFPSFYLEPCLHPRNGTSDSFDDWILCRVQ
jgi:hypothetical protein